jgi:D-serine deaminase-like pyridoxal phosphate-dependent protein
MKRRSFLIGGSALALAGGGFMLRPSDNGGGYTPYFDALNKELKHKGPGRSIMVIDHDRLMDNAHKIKASLPTNKHFRLVAKSLPSIPLLQAMMSTFETPRLMVFHQPHLNLIAESLPQSDLLLGKPMPINAAANFYNTFAGDKTTFNPAQQIQWLINSKERLQEYLQLAQSLGTKMRVNIEVDVGLHRGGLTSPDELKPLIDLITAHPDQLAFSGFMGYDAHIGKIPSILESHEESFRKATTRYRDMQNALYSLMPSAREENLTFNGAGSPTIRMHKEDSPLNELAAGSCLVKPTDFDVELLSDLTPACFIATPVLKSLEGTTIPGIEGMRGLLSGWNRNWQHTYFIYGGLWQAHYESPTGLEDNSLYGKSSNQAIVNGSHRVPLKVDDQIFLRPTQSERVLLEFGDIAVLKNGKISEWWPVLPA